LINKCDKSYYIRMFVCIRIIKFRAGILPVKRELFTTVTLTGLGDRPQPKSQVDRISTQPQRVLNLLCKRMETKHDQNSCIW
jgi:hypothetical protein